MLYWFSRRLAGPLPPPGGLTRDITEEGTALRIDLTPQVLSLSMGKERAWREEEDFLEPTCPDTGGFVSASMLAVKAKLFDDGLYAAAELATQPGKARLLAAFLDASPQVGAAARLRVPPGVSSMCNATRPPSGDRSRIPDAAARSHTKSHPAPIRSQPRRANAS